MCTVVAILTVVKGQALSSFVACGSFEFCAFLCGADWLPMEGVVSAMGMHQERANNPPVFLVFWKSDISAVRHKHHRGAEVSGPSLQLCYSQSSEIKWILKQEKALLLIWDDAVICLQHKKIAPWLCFSIQLPGNGVNGCQPVPGHSDGAGPWENVLPSVPNALWNQASSLCGDYSQGKGTLV